MSNAITKPGIYPEFDVAAYFADPCPTAALSQSIAKVLIEKSPLHASLQHPKLRGSYVREEKYDKDRAIGNACHSLMLGRGKQLAIIEADDLRTKIAQKAVKEARASGLELILTKHHHTAKKVVDSARKQLDHPDFAVCGSAFKLGHPEVVAASCENGVWLKAMIDWITPDYLEIYDYKTTGATASPYGAGAKMANDGWDIQAAMIERILDELDPKNAGRRVFRFICQENEPPYCLSVNELDEVAMTTGRQLVKYAVETWKTCLATNEWPGYPRRIIYPDVPAYRITQAFSLQPPTVPAEEAAEYVSHF